MHGRTLAFVEFCCRWGQCTNCKWHCTIAHTTDSGRSVHREEGNVQSATFQIRAEECDKIWKTECGTPIVSRKPRSPKFASTRWCFGTITTSKERLRPAHCANRGWEFHPSTVVAGAPWARGSSTPIQPQYRSSHECLSTIIASSAVLQIWHSKWHLHHLWSYRVHDAWGSIDSKSPKTRSKRWRFNGL